MVYRIPDALVFPDPELANPQGLLGVGGDLRPERLLLAYEMGIFPWFSKGDPILWWSPDPRFVLHTSALRIGRSLRKRLAKNPYRVTMDMAFRQVVDACARAPRRGQDATWITDEMIEAYAALHRQGLAHSVEAWQGDVLVGGLYGVFARGVFSGESMFAIQPDASKIAFVHLVRELSSRGIDVVDCQMRTEHLARFGAVSMPRRVFLAHLERGANADARRGRWRLECGCGDDERADDAR